VTATTLDVSQEGRRQRIAAAPPAVEIAHLAKTFRLPHQRYSTLKERVLHPFRSTTYDELRALSKVDVVIRQGEFFGIVGRNGSGKSTLLKCLAGIYRPDGGRVTIRGRLSPFIELGVGFNPELTARDNIRINGTLLGLSKRELARRYDEILAFSELERFVDQKLKNFSSGMQVRLAYAIGIQVDFDVLLLDEVLAVGDAAFQEKCFATFERFRAEGRTIVLVTHDLGVLRRFADRVALLLGGRMQALGPPEEVTETYQALAASFAASGAFAI
jgi:ABC-type polysaccharide/polyol phosphate transport system ATPase subunit